MKYISRNPVTRKSAISLCIALALQGNPVWAVETISTLNKGNQSNCPKDLKSLTKEQKEKLPVACLKEESSFLEESWEWVAGGVAAAAVVGIAVYSNDNGDGDNSHNGDDVPTPPVPGTASFTNGVEWNGANSTLTIKGVAWSYSKNEDGTYKLTNPATGQTAVLEKWAVNKDDNTITLTGKNSDGSKLWIYDRSGKFSQTDAANGHQGNGQQINTNGGQASGPGNSGQIISGDGNDINNNGDNSATNGGTGTSVDGNGNTIDNKGSNTADGEGSTGTDVTGDNNKINNEGDSATTNGATGTNVDGNDNTIDNKGNSTTEGAGSTGTDVAGNNNTINNTGSADVSNGGTGTNIAGDDNTVNNKGKIAVDGEGSTGTKITGNGAVVNNDGDATVTGGSTGTQIDGDNAAVVNTGDFSVDGAGSTGTLINGNNAQVSQNGDILVTKGATGIAVNGNQATITNTGKITVQDKGSFGININATSAETGNTTFTNNGDIIARLNGTGVNISSDNTRMDLNGNILVEVSLDDAGKAQGANGINVSGDNSTVNLDGSLTLKAADGVTVNNSSAVNGLTISGSDNSVNIKGAVVINSDNIGGGSKWTGVKVSGQNNNVVVSDGLKLSHQNANTLSETALIVDGSNTVTVGGDSSFVNMAWVPDDSYLIEITNGGTLNFIEGSTFDIKSTFTPNNIMWDSGVIRVSGKNSSVNNAGVFNELNSESLQPFFYLNNGATGVNTGEMNAELITQNSFAQLPMIQADNGSTAINSGKLSIKTATVAVGGNQYANAGQYPLGYFGGVYYGMLANGNSSSMATNTQEGEINLAGVGLYGMASSNGATVVNEGKISLDGSIQNSDGSKGVYTPSAANAFTHGAGMLAGSNIGNSGGDANAVNRGNITVNNAGFGMVAIGAGTVTNEGVITLNADSGFASDGTAYELVGIGVFGGGSAVNDTTGVININATNGKAFYSDGNANNRIINRGVINLGVGVPDTADNSAAVVSPTLADGSDLSGSTLNKTTSVASGTTVKNTGMVDGSSALFVEGTFNNLSGAVTSAPVSVSKGGVVNNSGTLAGATTVKNGTLTNESTGAIKTRVMVSGAGKVANSGSMTNGAGLTGSAKVTNSGTFTLGSSTDAKNASMLELKDTSVFDNLSGGTLTLDNDKNGIHLNNDSTLKNEKGATITVSNSATGAGINLWGGTADFINDGTAYATGKTLAGSSSDAAAGKAFVWNQDDGVMNFTATASGQSAVSLTNNNYVGLNDGTMNISGNGAIAMKGSKNAQLVNNGTINLGTAGTDQSGMIAMQLDANATADAVIENNGAINIYAKDSYAFSRLGTNGRIINNGTVKLDGEGSGLVKESGVTLEGNGTGGNGTETHAATYTLPVDATAPVQNKGLRSSVSQYTVGTNASGTAGILTGNNLDLDDVKVDTGFTAGTAATTETFNDVFVGEDIQGVQNIQSASVVWTAQGQKDASGNVDVTMTKNAYTDVVDDSSVSSVAKALDAGYTNNQLYNSLNLATSADVTKAMKQISGSMANSVSRDARVLSNRFDMLADTAPVMKNGLAFNAVAQGDKRAELGNNTTFDMMALRQKLEFGGNQTLSMEYGIARINSNGTDIAAGDNGLAGGYSQFFGLNHEMPLGENGLSWNNALRYDVHQFDSNRAISYGDVSETAKADNRQQYLELRSEGRKTFTVQEGFDVAPYAGVKLRHTIEDGYQENGAGDFNLNMSSSTETAVDSVVGMQLRYAGKNGWAATATLEGGPNLSYISTNKKAMLQGAAGQYFNVEDGQKGGGVNSKAQVGVKYNADNTSAGLEAFHWKEDGLSDKGLMMNYKVSF